MAEAEHSPVIRSLLVGPYQAQCYIVACHETLQAVVIDPGAEAERIAATVKLLRVDVRYILNTHGHPDHVWGNGPLSRLVGAPCAMHGADIDFFQNVGGPEKTARPPAADVRLNDGDLLEVGDLSFTVLHTPGHTPGSVCFLCQGHVFTGDTLFVGAVGRTDLGGGGLDTLLASIENKILPLPGDTVIHPGHDYGEAPISTLDKEKESNIYITDFIMNK